MRRAVRTRLVPAVVAGAAMVVGAMLPTTGTSAAQGPCGLTTLDATLVDTNGDGVLECGPPQPLFVRQDLAAALPTREATREGLRAFFTLADFQLADEESPLRGEWADKCGDIATRSAFRPHETMVTHMLNAHVRAANAIADAKSPVLRKTFDFAVALGDLADNQQYNEVREFIDILDGQTLVDPDSGNDPQLGALTGRDGEGYDGVQGADPTGGIPPLPSPVEGETLLDLANEPFVATGLRTGKHLGAERLPWYSVLGNHDVKVQGTLPDDNEAWRQFARAWVVGRLKVQDLAPDHQQTLCEDPSKLVDPEFWMDVAANPGTTKVVPADPDRRLLDRAEWIAEHDNTSGVPDGHGFLPAERRCRDENGALIPRGCYSFSDSRFHYIALDSNPAEGLESGNIDDPQFRWLERELIANSKRYFDENGLPVTVPSQKDRYVVVFVHHTIASTTNTGLPPGSAQGIHTGAELESLLLRFPNVILQADGHSHENRLIPHRDATKGTAYWEINTSAIADFPTQSRTVEIADNRDGTLSIFAVVFDAWVGPNARLVDWTLDDPTDETAGPWNQARTTNEDWLAAAGREIAFNDPQADLMAPGVLELDRNAELLLLNPLAE